MCLLACRLSKHESTGATAELYFARDLRLSLNLVARFPDETKNSKGSCVQV